MQHGVFGEIHEYRRTAPLAAAQHDQVRVLFLGRAHDLGLDVACGNVAAHRSDAKRRGQFRQALFRARRPALPRSASPATAFRPSARPARTRRHAAATIRRPPARRDRVRAYAYLFALLAKIDDQQDLAVDAHDRDIISLPRAAPVEPRVSRIPPVPAVSGRRPASMPAAPKASSATRPRKEFRSVLRRIENAAATTRAKRAASGSGNGSAACGHAA